LLSPSPSRVQVLAEFQGASDYGNDAYGLSKACVNAYTRILAREHPGLLINSCTPGFIRTDLTAGMGATNPPKKGTAAPLFCLLGEVEGSGRYYGSDSQRSPLDRYRAPGDPPYAGD
jgi:NAD(P)-dependent dehydrogenase (short-subunit alcohol dehydrogenase family)